MRINYHIRIKAGRYNREWYLSDFLIPVGGMVDHFKKNGDTQLSLDDRTTLLNIIPDFIVLAACNAGWLTVFAYAGRACQRFVYNL